MTVMSIQTTKKPRKGEHDKKVGPASSLLIIRFAVNPLNCMHKTGRLTYSKCDVRQQQEKLALFRNNPFRLYTLWGYGDEVIRQDNNPYFSYFFFKLCNTCLLSRDSNYYIRQSPC